MNAEQLLTLSTAVADQDEVSWASYLDETKSDSLPLLRALRTIEKIGGISDRVSGEASAEVSVVDSQGSVYAGTTFVAPSIYSGVSSLVGNSIDGATSDAGSSSPRKLREKEPAGIQYQEGDRWQHLEIVELIGRGASASVYMAIDTVLGREVALKLIEVPPTASHRVVSNLLNEAQLLARIRHPNVSTVYGAARHQGFVGLWMELIRGQTLKDLVTRNGPLSWAETVVVVADVARAMRSLHQQGILHRDIKANNVLREAGGRIVLVDLGIGIEQKHVAATASKTAGTPLYLAPELLNGGAASIAADIYSFGVLCFFLATGRYPVEADSVRALALAHRLGDYRSLREHRVDLPEVFIDTVERALMVDPTQRFQGFHQMERALVSTLGLGVSSDGSSLQQQGPKVENVLRLGFTRGFRQHRPVLWLSAVALSLIVFWILGSRFGQSLESTSESAGKAEHRITFSFGPPAGLEMTDGARNVPSLAPDGRQIVYAATNGEGSRGLWTRPLDSLAAFEYKGTAGATYVFWAANSTSLGFFSDRQLKVIYEPDAPPLTLAPASVEPRGADWNRRDQILYSPGPRSGLRLVSLEDRSVRDITAVATDRGEIGHEWPQFLPDQDTFIFFVDSNLDEARGVYGGRLDGTRAKKLIDSDASAIFASGHLLFLEEGDLLARRLDPRSLSFEGSPKLVVESVASTSVHQLAVSASNSGLLCFIPAELRNRSHLVWRDLDGKVLGDVAGDKHLRNPALDPFNRYIAAEVHDHSPAGLRIFDTQRNRELPLGFSGSRNLFPVWSPEGDTLVFASDHKGALDLYRQSLDTIEPPQPVYISTVDKMPIDWSPDGRMLSFIEYSPEEDYNVFILSFSDNPTPQPLLESSYDELNARFSPSSQWLAYVSNESGSYEVYVLALDGSGRKCQITTSGGHDPVWGNDDRTIFFLDNFGHLYSSRLSGESCEVEEPKLIFRMQNNRPGSSRNHYAVAKSGGRILVNDPVSSEMGSKEFRLLVGWESTLER